MLNSGFFLQATPRIWGKGRFEPVRKKWIQAELESLCSAKEDMHGFDSPRLEEYY